MSARDTLFASIRQSLGVSGNEPARRAAVADRLKQHPRGVIPARGQLPAAERVKLFARMVEAANGSAEILPSTDDIPAAVAALLRRHNLPMQVRRGDDARLAALPWGKERTLEVSTGASDGHQLVSVSHAFAGVAETGTLIMASGPDNPTTLNFLPDTHVVVVAAKDIAGDYESVWASLREKFGVDALPRAINMITGPSRSADIAQILILGAHGPRRLHVLIVQRTAKVGRKFVCRVAAGESRHALSAVWRIWVAKNQPDLFIAVDRIGQIKASVHAPRAGKPTWKRHFGFQHGARGSVADAVLAGGASRHKASWTGAKAGRERTIEWRVFIPGGALRTTPLRVSEDTILLRPPAENEWLLVIVTLGPAQADPSDYPKPIDATVQLVATGELCDGRRVWITSCYIPPQAIPAPANRPRHYGSMEELQSAQGKLRAFAISDIADGSLGFFDLRVELDGIR